MTLVNITLTEEEQEVLLRMADEIGADRGTRTPWESVAQKILRAQEDFWAAEFNIPSPDDGHMRLEAMRMYQEKTTHPNPRDACGICGKPPDNHQEPDHGWQWLRPKE